MKKLITYTFRVLCVTLVIAVLPTEAESAIYEDTVRLHILAASDSGEDQALKIYLRDKLLDKYSDLMRGSLSAKDAAVLIKAQLPEIEESCNEWIKESGKNSRAIVTLTEEWFNTREYNKFTLPSGNYLSLKVIIDEGEGQNWWCVMYPPLCLDVATETKSSYTEEESRLISSSGYAVKFKLLELTSSFFR